MKKLINNCTIGMFLLLSLMYVSCSKEDDVDVKDYAFKASMEIIDDEGKEREVGTPIKLRITLDELKDRKDSLDITMSVGERKGEVYTEEKPSAKYQQNVTFRDAFRDNSVILNFVPKNGGKQIVKFVISNGKYSYTLEKELNVSTGTVITFTPLDPLKQVLNGRGSSGKIYIDNYKDEDNYYSVKFELIEGKSPCICQIITGNSHNPSDIVDMKDGETYRILDGKKAQSFVYNYYQNGEGHNTIRMSIIDRYGNVESRTYQLFYAPKVTITLYANGMGSTNPLDSNNDIGILNFYMESTYTDAAGKVEGYPVYCENLKAEFDVTYKSIKNGRTEVKTKHLELGLPPKTSRNAVSLLDENFDLGGVTILEKMKSTKEYEVKINNFKITGMNDSEGRTYVLDKILKYTEKKGSFLEYTIVAERTFNLQ